MNQEYMVVEKGTLLKLKSSITALVEHIDSLLSKGVGTLSFGEKEAEVAKEKNSFNKTKPSRKGGLSDILFAHAPAGEFGAREATEALAGKYKFDTDRKIDSVRAALKRDARFEKLSDGRFRRREFQLEKQ